MYITTHHELQRFEQFINDRISLPEKEPVALLDHTIRNNCIEKYLDEYHREHDPEGEGRTLRECIDAGVYRYWGNNYSLNYDKQLLVLCDTYRLKRRLD